MTDSALPGTEDHSQRIAGRDSDLGADTEIALHALLGPRGGQLVDVPFHLFAGHADAGIGDGQLDTGLAGWEIELHGLPPYFTWFSASGDGFDAVLREFAQKLCGLAVLAEPINEKTGLGYFHRKEARVRGCHVC